jgi:hypothetical protein
VSFEHEDRFDALEREHEERTRAAQDLAGMLGVSEAPEADPTPAAEPAPDAEEDRPRDERGRFKGSYREAFADAGEHGAPVLPTPNMGALILAHIDNDPSYLDERS